LSSLVRGRQRRGTWHAVEAEKEALLALMDGHIPYFAGAELLAAGSCSLAGPGPPRVAKEKAADLVGSAARAATEKAAAAMALAAFGVTVAQAAIEGEEAGIHPAREAAERAEAIGAAVEELVVQLERMEAERVRLETRLARELNADRGFVDASRSRSKARIDLTCFICMDIDSHVMLLGYRVCCAVEFCLLLGGVVCGWVKRVARVDSRVCARARPCRNHTLSSSLLVVAGDNLSLPCRKGSGVAERPPLVGVASIPFWGI
jgi:hypothetical protein